MGSAAMTECIACGTPICPKHAVWDTARGTWICTACERKPRG